MVTLHCLCLMAALSAAPGDTVLLEFTASWCGPCQSMRPAVERLRAAGYPVREVDVQREAELARQFDVSSLPCFVLVSGGRESARLVGATSYGNLVRMFQQASFQPGRPSGAALTQHRVPQGPPLIQPPDLSEGPNPSRQVAPPGQHARPGRAAPHAPPLAAARAAEPRPAARADTPTRAAPADRPAASVARAQPDAGGPEQRALSATVRIEVRDAKGVSYATGTIVDTHGPEVLAVTCGHVFRASQGRGQVLVDMFTPGGPQDVPAELVAWEAESRDVGLISFRPKVPVQVARVAARKDFAKGDLVFSIGCDHGADATVKHTRITGIDRYVGAPNIEIAGQPVDGRSGGGLFTAAGELIGVCNAADPTDDEGIYAALGAIHSHLKDNGFAYVYLDATPPGPGPESTPPRAPRTEADALISSVSHARGAAGMEVLCVVRPDGGSPQVILLNNPSPELLQRIRAEAAQQQSAPQVASQPTSAVIRGQSGGLRPIAR